MLAPTVRHLQIMNLDSSAARGYTARLRCLSTGLPCRSPRVSWAARRPARAALDSLDVEHAGQTVRASAWTEFGADLSHVPGAVPSSIDRSSRRASLCSSTPAPV